MVKIGLYAVCHNRTHHRCSPYLGQFSANLLECALLQRFFLKQIAIVWCLCFFLSLISLLLFGLSKWFYTQKDSQMNYCRFRIENGCLLKFPRAQLYAVKYEKPHKFPRNEKKIFAVTCISIERPLNEEFSVCIDVNFRLIFRWKHLTTGKKQFVLNKSRSINYTVLLLIGVLNDATKWNETELCGELGAGELTNNTFDRLKDGPKIKWRSTKSTEKKK